MQLVKTIIPFQLPENMSSILVYLTLSCMNSDGYRKKNNMDDHHCDSEMD